MKQVKCCGNCSRGARMSVNKDILCRIKGVVTQDFVCSRYLEIDISNPDEVEKYKCIDCEFFIQEGIGPDVPSNTGYCQLFTVRHYNGKSKKACSKFSRKVERIVS